MGLGPQITGSVHKLSTSNVCPDFVWYQKLWFVESFIGKYLDKHWIFASNLCPTAWAWMQIWQTFDKYWTDLVCGGPLDRHLTEFWQRLDKDWISCPISVQPTVGEEYPNMSDDPIFVRRKGWWMKFFALVGRRRFRRARLLLIAFLPVSRFAKMGKKRKDEEGRDELSHYFMHWCL